MTLRTLKKIELFYDFFTAAIISPNSAGRFKNATRLHTAPNQDWLRLPSFQRHQVEAGRARRHRLRLPQPEVVHPGGHLTEECGHTGGHQWQHEGPKAHHCPADCLFHPGHAGRWRLLQHHRGESVREGRGLNHFTFLSFKYFNTHIHTGPASSFYLRSEGSAEQISFPFLSHSQPISSQNEWNFVLQKRQVWFSEKVFNEGKLPL